MECVREGFTKEGDIGLDQPTARATWDCAASDVRVHVRVRVRDFTVNAALGSERAVGLDHFFWRDTGGALKAVGD